MAEAIINLDDDDTENLQAEKTQDEPIVVGNRDGRRVPQPGDAATSVNTIDCPICLQASVLPCKLPCGHIFCFLCVKGLHRNPRCAMCRQDFSLDYLDRPDLVATAGQQEPASGSTDAGEYRWFYKGRGGWWQYDRRTSNDIDEAYKNGEKFCTLFVAGYVYIVDFEQMLQQRQTDPSRKRQVKRDLASVPKKGVAGLRLRNAAAMEPLASEAAAVDGAASTSDSAVDNGASNVAAPIASTDAAMRIASNIIDSTLAHADEHRLSGQPHRNGPPSIGSVLAVGDVHRELLDQVEETLNISTAVGGTDAQATQTRPDDDIDNRLELTLDDFRRLSLGDAARNPDPDDADNEGLSSDGGARGRQTQSSSVLL